MSAALPAWAIYTMVGATVAGTAYAAYSQKRAGDAQASIAEKNAAIAERAAQDAIERGKVAENEQRQKVRQLQGEQKAAMAAAGADVQSGSNLDTLSDTAMVGEFDALTIRNNAAREAYGYRTQSAQYSAEAALAQQRGTSSLYGSLLTMPTQAALTYKTLRG